MKIIQLKLVKKNLKMFKYTSCKCYKNYWVAMFFKTFRFGKYRLHIILENGES